MIEKKDSQNDSIVVDTSVLLEYLEDTPLGKKVFQKVLSNEEIKKFYIAPIVDTELKYILCRRKGYGKAIKIVSELLKDFAIYSEEDLRDEAAHLKCDFAISLADCYGLATAKLLDIPIYMKKEVEIEKVFKKLSLIVKIKFINDLK
ncbi:MAG: type II toxin-antitoxin system VapC family toxin [Promethearchaeota archaeon]|nr:MAG: type II toxin-antitoxin system VapC family toxin [Candidatus Lokiarchaeota archaeon]